MLEHVKVCPKCGYINPEDRDICDVSNCGEYLGFVNPVPATDVRQGTIQEKKINSQESKAVSKPTPQTVPVTQRYEAQPILYLELAGQAYEIKNGWIIGLEHPTSKAHIQLPHISGTKRNIHRQHCFFEYANDQWFVYAIAQESYTNPTFVNQTRIHPGQRHPINHGDKLTLSDVTLSVRII